MQKRIEEVQRFKDLFPEWQKRMREHERGLCNIAHDIDTVHQNATVANITGTSIGLVGGILSIGGLISAPFTMRLSLGLMGVGAGIGVVGGVTNVAASGVDAFKQGKLSTAIDEIMEQYKGQYKNGKLPQSVYQRNSILTSLH
uniref:Apolipo L3-like protein n=1 Tax=Callorhinchus milii TaxID=7868 RepID=A0A4W3ICC9_CALMI